MEQSSEDHARISTFAVLDLETTNLPAYNNNRVGITELCIYAFDAAILRGTPVKSDVEAVKIMPPPPPRVVHKLNLLFQPSMMVHPEAESATGLSNYLLERESKFDAHSVGLVLSFLKHLPKPICLVAHNGWGFDFPILRQALEKHASEEDQYGVLDGITCVDSLRAFLEIDDKRANAESSAEASSESPVEEAEKKELPDLPELSDGETKEEVIQQTRRKSATEERELPELPELSDGETKEEVIQQTRRKSATEERELPELPELSDGETKEEVIEQTRKKPATVDWRAINETTPKRPTLPRSEAFLKRKSLNDDEEDVSPANRTVQEFRSRRQLFSGMRCAETKRFPPRLKYRLGNLYTSRFNCPATDAHRAEADVAMLTALMQDYSLDFLAFAEEQAIPFLDVTPLGTPAKRKH
ncbi:hypothetical protein KR018_004189 [Drosophila ironensis]|nr:hypothetical protein KR018_004189 [Drosophila ironensis]